MKTRIFFLIFFVVLQANVQAEDVAGQTNDIKTEPESDLGSLLGGVLGKVKELATQNTEVEKDGEKPSEESKSFSESDLYLEKHESSVKSDLPACKEGPVKTWNDCFGQSTSRNGSIYKGEWKSGLRHGFGKARSDQITFIGQFVQDQATVGRAKIKLPGGALYEGDYANNLPEGKGILISADGTKYVGEFQGGKKNGLGTIFGPDQEIIYVGEFRSGKLNGEGIKYSLDKKILFQGLWVDGKESQDKEVSSRIKKMGPSDGVAGFFDSLLKGGPKSPEFAIQLKNARLAQDQAEVACLSAEARAFAPIASAGLVAMNTLDIGYSKKTLKTHLEIIGKSTDPKEINALFNQAFITYEAQVMGQEQSKRMQEHIAKFGDIEKRNIAIANQHILTYTGIYETKVEHGKDGGIKFKDLKKLAKGGKEGKEAKKTILKKVAQTKVTTIEKMRGLQQDAEAACAVYQDASGRYRMMRDGLTNFVGNLSEGFRLIGEQSDRSAEVRRKIGKIKESLTIVSRENVWVAPKEIQVATEDLADFKF